jgi:hypothetical protein
MALCSVTQYLFYPHINGRVTHLVLYVFRENQFLNAIAVLEQQNEDTTQTKIQKVNQKGQNTEKRKKQTGIDQKWTERREQQTKKEERHAVSELYSSFGVQGDLEYGYNRETTTTRFYPASHRREIRNIPAVPGERSGPAVQEKRSGHDITSARTLRQYVTVAGG